MTSNQIKQEAPEGNIAERKAALTTMFAPAVAMTVSAPSLTVS